MMQHLLNRITNGDCIQVMKEIPNNHIDLVVTSPPYNLDIKYDVWNDNLPLEEYKSFIKKVAKELYRITKSDGRVCINIPCDGKMLISDGLKEKCDISYIIKNIFYEVGFQYRDKIYWDKQNLKSPNAVGSYRSASCPNILLPFEEIIVFYKETRKKYGPDNSDILAEEFNILKNGHWRIAGEGSKKTDCPAPFPEKIPENLIKFYSYKGDIVLDPFAGSGTTCIVAKRLERQFIGIELSPTYTQQAIDRIE